MFSYTYLCLLSISRNNCRLPELCTGFKALKEYISRQNFKCRRRLVPPGLSYIYHYVDAGAFAMLKSVWHARIEKRHVFRPFEAFGKLERTSAVRNQGYSSRTYSRVGTGSKNFQRSIYLEHSS
jgi:hypothetical protein